MSNSQAPERILVDVYPNHGYQLLGVYTVVISCTLKLLMVLWIFILVISWLLACYTRIWGAI